MMRLLLGALTAFPGASAAPDQPDALGLVFIQDSGPVLLRIQPRAGEQSVHALFRDHLKKWFDFLDSNHDGKLDAKELVGAPKAAAMAQLVRDGFVAGPASFLTLADLKKGPEQSATFDDFLSYYRRNNVHALQIVPTLRGAQFADTAGESLFKILDTNNDGKLSREEVAAAPLLLRKLDLDDDEMISAQELVASSAVSIPGMARKPSAGNSFGMTFYPLVTTGDRDRLPQILLSHFDKDRNRKLSQKECGFDAETFASLDTNKDGELDARELAAWIDGPADFELVLQLPMPGQEMTLALKAAGARFQKNHQRTSPLSYLLRLGDAEINVQGRDAGSANRPGQVNLPQFRSADKEERGYVELADLQEPEFRFLKDFFPLLDRDNDGRITEEEFVRFSALQSEGQHCQAALVVIEHGRALFQLLDANRDGRLSVHELRDAWARLEPLDVDKKGYVTAEQITQQYQIVVAPGSSRNLLSLGVAGLKGMDQESGNALSSRDVPEWFRKMDANGDGFISPREFLGSRADFKRIDVNGDGLIDPQEARQFDAQVRGKKPPS